MAVLRSRDPHWPHVLHIVPLLPAMEDAPDAYDIRVMEGEAEIFRGRYGEQDSEFENWDMEDVAAAFERAPELIGLKTIALYNFKTPRKRAAALRVGPDWLRCMIWGEQTSYSRHIGAEIFLRSVAASATLPAYLRLFFSCNSEQAVEFGATLRREWQAAEQRRLETGVYP